MVRGMTPRKYMARIRDLKSEVCRWRNHSGEMARQRDEARKHVREHILDNNKMLSERAELIVAKNRVVEDLHELREDTKERILKLNFERDALASTIHSMAQALSRRQMINPPLRSERSDAASKMYGKSVTALGGYEPASNSHA